MLSHTMQAQTHSVYLFSSVRKRRFASKPRTRKFRIPVYLLCFITEGEGVVLIDSMLHEIRPFELYLLVPGMIVEISERSGTFDYYGVFFQPLTLTKAKGSMTMSSSIALSGSFLPGRIPNVQPQQILHRILHMYESSRGQRKMDSLSLRLQLEQFIQDIITSTAGTNERKDERIERSIAYMEQHYIDKISMGRLAEEAGLAPVAYSRLFHKEMGATPVEYLSTIRMNKAKELLHKSGSRVKEVAAAVGFRSEFYFSRMFQREIGIAPTLYMRRGALRVAVASSLGFEQYLQSLGIQPVCVLDLFQYPELSEDEYAQRSRIQRAELINAAPDLIIADDYHADFKPLFKQVAASVVLDLSIWDWKRNFLKIAELLGREMAAAEALTRLEIRTAEVKRALQNIWGKRRISIIQVSHRAIGIQGTAGHPLNELIYGELALKPGAPEVGDIWRQEMPPEALPLLDTEYLFIHKHHVLAGSEGMYQRLEQSEHWPQIPAVQRGEVRLIPNWFAMSWTPIGREAIMEHFMQNKQLSLDN